MYSVLCGRCGVCVCGQNSNPRDGPASILLTESSSQRTFYLHVCVVYVHLHLCACVCVVQACGDLKLISFVFLYDYCIY